MSGMGEVLAMSISYSTSDSTTSARPVGTWLLNRLLLVNALLAIVSVCWWTFIAPYVSEPIKWATRQGLGTNPGLFEYPYNLFWLLPCAGICVAWLAFKSEKKRAAVWCAAFPLFFLGLIIAWYDLVPNKWH